MTDPYPPSLDLTTVLVVLGVNLLVTVLVYVWYALALSKVFTKLGDQGWRAWVPVYNEVRVLVNGGVPGWSVVYYFIPIVNLYGLYLRITALHRIDERFGKGAGFTVLGILLPPVWASILGFGSAQVKGEFDRRVSTMVTPSTNATGPLASPPAEPVTAAHATPAASAPIGFPPPPAYRDAAPSTPAAQPAPSAAEFRAPERPAPSAPVAPAAPAASAPAPGAPAPTAPGTISNPWAPREQTPPPAPERPQAPARRAETPQEQRPAAPEAPSGPEAPRPEAPRPADVAPSRQPQMIEFPRITAPPAAGSSVPPPDAPTFTPAPSAPPFAPSPASVASAPSAADSDDDFDETVVVDRRPKVRWRLSVDGGHVFELTADRVLLGRKPLTEPGAQSIAVPDGTRTLSKTHARLDLADGRWTVTDLDSTNGVIIIEPDASENLLTVGASAVVVERFVLGEVGMSLEFTDDA